MLVLLVTGAVAVAGGWLAQRRGHRGDAYGLLVFALVAAGATYGGLRYLKAEEQEWLGRVATGRAPRPVPFEYGWPLAGAALGITCVLVLPDRARQKCPACAEWVRREARKCRYCGEDIGTPREAA
jgi:hypothetical protein